MNRIRWLSLFVFTACAGIPLRADVLLSALFSDHAVLQQSPLTPVWGRASAGEHIEVRLGDQKASTTTASDGTWRINLNLERTGPGPHDLIVTGNNQARIVDVLVGQVWLGAGQSNMENGLMDKEERVHYSSTALRHFRVQRNASPAPATELQGKWVISGPDSWLFSGMSYYFGKTLHQALKTPVGIITSAYGGSPITAWVSRQTLDAATGIRVPEMPGAQRAPSCLFNGMLTPVVPYGLAGVVWYQGEEDASRAADYAVLLPLLIKEWRAAWHRPDLPFVICQLPLYGPRATAPVESDWAELREAQARTADTVPHVGLAVLLDLGEEADIHPADKAGAGARAARIALADVYRQKIAAHSPAYAASRVEGNRMRIRFSNSEYGLLARPLPSVYQPKSHEASTVPLARNSPNSEIEGFAICGADHRWVWADAKIDGNDVLAWSSTVPKPVAVRYAWASTPTFNLYARSGLPVAPFRTDTFPRAK